MAISLTIIATTIIYLIFINIAKAIAIDIAIVNIVIMFTSIILQSIYAN